MQIVPNLGMIVPNMGTKAVARDSAPIETGLADALFTPVQQRVLGLLFGQPDRSFQGNELIRLAESGTGAVHRFLTRLTQAGLVTIERIGNQKHYRANRESPIFGELRGLMEKTSGLVIPLREALAAHGAKIAAAFVYGSIAKRTDRAASDIDLMVISRDLSYVDLNEALEAAEATLSRPINPNLMTPEEWRRKRVQKGSFAARIAAQPRLFLIGSDDELG